MISSASSSNSPTPSPWGASGVGGVTSVPYFQFTSARRFSYFGHSSGQRQGASGARSRSHFRTVSPFWYVRLSKCLHSSRMGIATTAPLEGTGACPWYGLGPALPRRAVGALAGALGVQPAGLRGDPAGLAHHLRAGLAGRGVARLGGAALVHDDLGLTDAQAVAGGQHPRLGDALTLDEG